MSDETSATGRLDPDRLMTFSDGVIAIAITILVFGIDIPTDNSFSEQGSFTFFARIRHDVVVYAACVWIFGAFWVQHHAVFNYFRYCDRFLVSERVSGHLYILGDTAFLPFASPCRYPSIQTRSPILLSLGCHDSLRKNSKVKI